jgi:hypothetical protein
MASINVFEDQGGLETMLEMVVQHNNEVLALFSEIWASRPTCPQFLHMANGEQNDLCSLFRLPRHGEMDREDLERARWGLSAPNRAYFGIRYG